MQSIGVLLVGALVEVLSKTTIIPSPRPPPRRGAGPSGDLVHAVIWAGDLFLV